MCNLPSGILGGISRSLEVFLSRKERRTLWTKIDILFSTFCRHFALIYLIYILVFTLFSFWQNTLNQGMQTRFFSHFCFFYRFIFAGVFQIFTGRISFLGLPRFFTKTKKIRILSYFSHVCIFWPILLCKMKKVPLVGLFHQQCCLGGNITGQFLRPWLNGNFSLPPAQHQTLLGGRDALHILSHFCSLLQLSGKSIPFVHFFFAQYVHFDRTIPNFCTFICACLCFFCALFAFCTIRTITMLQFIFAFCLQVAHYCCLFHIAFFAWFLLCCVPVLLFYYYFALVLLIRRGIIVISDGGIFPPHCTDSWTFYPFFCGFAHFSPFGTVFPRLAEIIPPVLLYPVVNCNCPAQKWENLQGGFVIV